MEVVGLARVLDELEGRVGWRLWGWIGHWMS